MVIQELWDKPYCGSALDFSKILPDASVDCVITSPPYWGLRDYGGMAGQYGLEPTPLGYIRNLVDLFTEIKRVLKPTATVWLNLGDSYSGSNGNTSDNECGPNGIDHRAKARPSRVSKKSTLRAKPIGDHEKKRQVEDVPMPAKHSGLPPKNLMMIPARVAIALQDIGYYIRSEIIWHKPAPMPESVKDRPTRAHEMIYMLTINEKYFYNQIASLEPTSLNSHGGGKVGDHRKQYNGGQTGLMLAQIGEYRNMRDVWTIHTDPYPDAHFATFPLAIPQRCIQLGCPEGGVVYDPFLGSGTTAQAAQGLGCHWVGSELNPEYIPLIEKRTAQKGLFVP